MRTLCHELHGSIIVVEAYIHPHVPYLLFFFPLNKALVYKRGELQGVLNIQIGLFSFIFLVVINIVIFVLLGRFILHLILVRCVLGVILGKEFKTFSLQANEEPTEHLFFIEGKAFLVRVLCQYLCSLHHFPIILELYEFLQDCITGQVLWIFF